MQCLSLLGSSHPSHKKWWMVMGFVIWPKLRSCNLLQVQCAGGGGKGEDHRQKVLQKLYTP